MSDIVVTALDRAVEGCDIHLWAFGIAGSRAPISKFVWDIDVACAHICELASDIKVGRARIYELAPDIQVAHARICGSSSDIHRAGRSNYREPFDIWFGSTPN